MPDAYEVYEGRFIQEGISVSAADALSVTMLAACPRNKMWTVIQATYYPSVAETRTVAMGLVTSGAKVMPITLPQSWAYINVNLAYPMLREGMELKLFPGDYIYVARDVATAGSTMTLLYRYIESALPIYEEYEPQLRRAQIRKRGSTGQRSIGGGLFGGGGEPGIPPAPAPGGGEGGGGEPSY